MFRSGGSNGPAVRSAWAGPGCSRGEGAPARWRLAGDGGCGFGGGGSGGGSCGGCRRDAGRHCRCPWGTSAAAAERRGPAPAAGALPLAGEGVAGLVEGAARVGARRQRLADSRDEATRKLWQPALAEGCGTAWGGC